MKDKNYSNNTNDSVRERINKAHEIHLQATKEVQEALKKWKESEEYNKENNKE